MTAATITYLDHEQQRQTRVQDVSDLSRPTIAAWVDMFDAQVGTVLAVKHGDTVLYRAKMETPTVRPYLGAYVERIAPLLRCSHNRLLLDRRGVAFNPHCGCRYVERAEPLYPK